MIRNISAKFGGNDWNFKAGSIYTLQVEILPSGIINVHYAPSPGLSFFLSYKNVEELEQNWKTLPDKNAESLSWAGQISIWKQEEKNKTDESNSNDSGGGD